MCVLIYRYVYGVSVSETHRGKKRVSSPLEMEFHTAVPHVGVGNSTLFLWKSSWCS